jgi:class 3 adenylate cyclase
MATLTGYGTKWAQVRATNDSQIPDNDLAWEVMFVYGEAHPALRSIQFAGHAAFDPLTVYRILIDKQTYGAETRPTPVAEGVPSSGASCRLCRIPFGCWYDDPTFGRIRITRNRRNRYYCNICDAFIRLCPGQAILQLPVLVVDVKQSREIRSTLADLRTYARLLATFQRHVETLIQEHMGFVLNTVGDAVVGVWPSGFVPREIRDRLGWSIENPARVSAIQATDAALAIAASAPSEFDGKRLPYRGALDTTEMVVFAVTTGDPESAAAFATGPEDEHEVGDPVLSAEASDIGLGPAATDIAGEAIETAMELASDSDLPPGVVCITERTDVMARRAAQKSVYRRFGSTMTPARIISAPPRVVQG